MTVTDCHHEKKAVQKREHAKKFSLFGKGLQMTSTDRHPTVTKKAKKPEKLGGGGRWKSNTYLTHGVKKVYFFLSIERYVNDLLRLPPFAPPTGDGITTNIFKKIALHFAPFMI